MQGPGVLWECAPQQWLWQEAGWSVMPAPRGCPAGHGPRGPQGLLPSATGSRLCWMAVGAVGSLTLWKTSLRKVGRMTCLRCPDWCRVALGTRCQPGRHRCTAVCTGEISGCRTVTCPSAVQLERIGCERGRLNRLSGPNNV